MKSIFYLLVIVLSSTLISCTYLKNVQLLSGGELKRQQFVEAIPFEMRKDLIVVKATVNADSTEREFIFDTGAFNSKIEKGLAESLGLKTITTKSNSTAAGVNRIIEVTRIDSLVFGETAFYNVGAGKVEYDEQSASPCIAQHGIIGANIMKLAHWRIDYEHQMIYFSDQPFEVKESAYNIEFDSPLLSGTPLISMKIGGKEAQNILFDVGYNGGLVLPIALAKEFEGSNKLFFDRSTTGIYGAKTDTLIEKQLEIEIDGFKTTLPVNFSANGKALLGNEFLKHFDVIINYEEDLIRLVERMAVSIQPSVRFIPGILNDNQWVVNRTTEDLPFELGDTLSTVNGKIPADLYANYCDYRMHVGALINTDSLKLVKLSGKEFIINN
ncbi:Aspartyl protease [Marivirga sericea]|uniref:Aspartyl protease n=1 Tax=Marivirga sericea TaxID=1028 RepID=A0A1X7I977_9BACT|nr:retropepsin-like aspartic protease [Marivirga sericea]SMG10658.1 Aspartyl protease [Marivirga sericea]